MPCLQPNPCFLYRIRIKRKAAIEVSDQATLLPTLIISNKELRRLFAHVCTISTDVPKSSLLTPGSNQNDLKHLTIVTGIWHINVYKTIVIYIYMSIALRFKLQYCMKLPVFVFKKKIGGVK